MTMEAIAIKNNFSFVAYFQIFLAAKKWGKKRKRSACKWFMVQNFLTQQIIIKEANNQLTDWVRTEVPTTSAGT